MPLMCGNTGVLYPKRRGRAIECGVRNGNKVRRAESLWYDSAMLRWVQPLGLAILGLLAAGLLTARLATLAPIGFALDDPGWQADGFYAPETSTDGVRF